MFEEDEFLINVIRKFADHVGLEQNVEAAMCLHPSDPITAAIRSICRNHESLSAANLATIILQIGSATQWTGPYVNTFLASLPGTRNFSPIVSAGGWKHHMECRKKVPQSHTAKFSFDRLRQMTRPSVMGPSRLVMHAGAMFGAFGGTIHRTDNAITFYFDDEETAATIWIRY